MFLGTNPGGRSTAAREAHRRLPFEKPGWSAYLDEDWNGHALQSAATKIAGAFASAGQSGKDVLRRSPSGNLIPFRSERGVLDLPKGLRSIKFGVRLIELAQPRILVLFESDKKHWCQLMDAFGRSREPTHTHDLGAGWYREAVLPRGKEQRPRYVFALPWVKTRNGPRNPEVIGILSDRVGHHGLGRRRFDDTPALRKKRDH